VNGKQDTVLRMACPRQARCGKLSSRWSLQPKRATCAEEMRREDERREKESRRRNVRAAACAANCGRPTTEAFGGCVSVVMVMAMAAHAGAVLGRANEELQQRK
jgi:hypothetical protein